MISGIVISHNEEENIARAIASLKRVTNEVILVDAESTDDTRAIAEELGARVFIKPWTGYGDAKNFAAGKAKNNWLFSLDADEVISEELAGTINSLSYNPMIAYHVRIVMNYLGKKLRFTEYAPHWKPRLYHKDHFHWDQRVVHEKLVSIGAGKLQRIKGDLWHFSFQSKQHHKDKIDRYARLSALELKRKGITPGLLKRTLGPSYRFLRSYILKLGFLEGKEGLFISKMAGKLVQQRHAYYRDL